MRCFNTLPPPDIGRRAILGGMAFLAQGTAPAWRAAAGERSAMFAYVGCRTTRERNARGEGLRVFRIDPSTAAWTPVQLVTGLDNPSFLAFDRQQRFLYAVHGDLNDISAFRVAPDTGALTLLNRQSTGGRNPVHLAPDPDNQAMIVANYATGTVALLPRAEDGSLGPVQQVEALPGTPGPNKVDQTASHPHEIAYDPQRHFMLVPDKGLDRIFTLRFDPAQNRLSIVGSLAVWPGAGPRHAVFHPSAPFVFVAHELDASVGAYRYDPDTGRLTGVQVIPSTPDTFTGANTAAEIALSADGRFVFVSNRGHDSIGTFAADPANGRLTPVGWASSDGQGPRFVALDLSGAVLYAANENSDTIVPFRVDAATGRLSREGDMIHTGSPVCIVFRAGEAG